MKAYFIVAGLTGLTVQLMSYGDGIHMTCLTDTNIMSEPEVLMAKLERNIKLCMKDDFK